MSTVVSAASDPGNKTVKKGLSNLDGKPCQSCDIVIRIKDSQPVHTYGIFFVQIPRFHEVVMFHLLVSPMFVAIFGCYMNFQLYLKYCSLLSCLV